MKEKAKVLFVDDADEMLDFYREVLRDDYVVFTANSGERALGVIEDIEPEVVVLDVNMPGMSGYETCRKIKERHKGGIIDVVFVTGNDTIEEKLKGYDAGAANYLGKPVDVTLLVKCLTISIENRKLRKNLELEKKDAMEVAMVAMSSAGELGVILEFMRTCFATKDLQSLVDLVVDMTCSYDLESTVQIRGKDTTFNSNVDRSVTPLEEELLSRVRFSGKLRESGDKLVVNFGCVTQIIKNMPDDDAKRGRLRDHLAMLIEAADVQAKALEMHRQLRNVVRGSNGVLKDIQDSQKAQKDKSMSIVDHIMGRVDQVIFSAGLSEAQEQMLQEIMTEGVAQFLDNFEQGIKLDESVSHIIDQLNVILEDYDPRAGFF